MIESARLRVFGTSRNRQAEISTFDQKSGFDFLRLRRSGSFIVTRDQFLSLRKGDVISAGRDSLYRVLRNTGPVILCETLVVGGIIPKFGHSTPIWRLSESHYLTLIERKSDAV